MDGSAPATDRALILALLREEIEAFQRADFKAWSALWVQDERVRDIYHSQLHGTAIMRGWSQVGPAMAKLMKGRGAHPGVAYRQFDHNLTIRGDTAWVTYRTANEDPLCPSDLHEELRILERGDDGEWRLVCMSVASSGSRQRLAGAVEVDGQRRVLWQGERAASILADHPVLTIAGGRLGTHRAADGAALREAISRAAALARTSLSLDPDQLSDAVTFPVVLGLGDDGETLICLVRVTDGRVFVDLQPGAEIARRLIAGAILFGLSKAQTALARKIADGLSLPAAAESASVSVTTARTHLTRIYEKTGTCSQTALIRLLLSVG